MSRDTNLNHVELVNLTPQQLGMDLLRAIEVRASIEDIRNLIERGADINMARNDGWTPLLAACYRNNTEIATLLIERGADVNITDNYGQTPLLSACTSNNPELATLLIERGADVNSTDNYGWTPLHWACTSNNPELATLLIERGADVNLSLLKSFVIGDEHNQIDAIINNVPQEPIQLHLRPDSNPAILDLLVCPDEFRNVNLIGGDGNPVELNCGEAYLLK